MNTRIGDLIEVPSVKTVVRLEEGRTQSKLSHPVSCVPLMSQHI